MSSGEPAAPYSQRGVPSGPGSTPGPEFAGPPLRELLGAGTVDAHRENTGRRACGGVEEGAEFVAFRIGQGGALGRVFGQNAGPQLQKWFDRVDVDVQVDAVLDRLGPGLRPEQQIGERISGDARAGIGDRSSPPSALRQNAATATGSAASITKPVNSTRHVGARKAERAAMPARCRVNNASGISTVARLATALSTSGRRLTMSPIIRDSRTSARTRGRRNASNRVNAVAGSGLRSRKSASTAASSIAWQPP